MKDCRLQISNRYFIYLINFLIFFLKQQNLLSQQLLNPTYTNHNVENKKKVNFMGSMGETFVSTKYLKNYVIIEGFYGYNMQSYPSVLKCTLS